MKGSRELIPHRPTMLMEVVMYRCTSETVHMHGAVSCPVLSPAPPIYLPSALPPHTRLYAMGVIPVKQSLVGCEKLATSAFCRRRLSVVMVRCKMAETLREAVTFIEQVRAWPPLPLLLPLPPLWVL